MKEIRRFKYFLYISHGEAVKLHGFEVTQPTNWWLKPVTCAHLHSQ